MDEVDCEFQNEYAAVRQFPDQERHTKVMWAVRDLEPGKYGYEPTFRTNAEAHAFRQGAQRGTLVKVVRYFPYNPDDDGPRDIGDGGHQEKLDRAQYVIDTYLTPNG